MNYELRQEILDALYEKYLKDNRVPGTWRFSDCGYLGMDGYCRRKRVLKFHGIPGVVNDEQKRVFLRGHLAEGIMLEGLQMRYPGICYQPFPEGLQYQIPGHKDIVFAGRTDFYVPPYLVIDGKNISVDAIMDQAREGHVCQVTMTMAGLKQVFGSEWEPQGMVYYQREGRAFDIAPFDVPYSGMLVRALAEEVVELHEKYGNIDSITGGEGSLRSVQPRLIEGMESAVKFPCSWWNRQAKHRATCDYFSVCWPDFKEPPKVRKPSRRRTTT